MCVIYMENAICAVWMHWSSKICVHCVGNGLGPLFNCRGSVMFIVRQARPWRVFFSQNASLGTIFMYVLYFHKTTSVWLLQSWIYFYIDFCFTIINHQKSLLLFSSSVTSYRVLLIWVFMLDSYYACLCPSLVTYLWYPHRTAHLTPFSSSLVQNVTNHLFC